MSEVTWWSMGFLTLAFSLVLYLLWARVLFQFAQVKSVPAFIAKFWQKLDASLGPLAYFLFHVNRGPIAWVTIAVILMLDFIRISLSFWIISGHLYAYGIGTILWLADGFIFPLQILFYAMLLRIVLGWIPALKTNKWRLMVVELTAPYINAMRDWLPIVRGFDFVPLLWAIVFWLGSFFMYAAMPVHPW